MSEYTIYHNPRCSKSRQTLAILEEKGIDPNIILYLNSTPNENELLSIIKKLGISPRDLLRKGETAYKDQGLSDTSLSDKDLVSAMIEHPKLIERPIVVKGERAVLGRPPENVLELI